MTKINPIQAQKHLKGLDYPANKEQIIQRAKDAPNEIKDVLGKIPDKNYEKPTEVNKAIGEINNQN